MAADREETPKDTHNSKDSSSGADEVALPPGWFATKAASGQTYYYNLLAQTTLDRPTEPLRSSKASSSTAPGSKQKAKPGSPISRTSSSDRQIETSSTMPAEQRKPADSAYGKPSGKKPIAAADVSQKPREWQPSHQGFQRLVRILKYKNPIEIMRSVKRLFRSYRFLRPYLVKTDICFKVRG